MAVQKSPAKLARPALAKTVPALAKTVKEKILRGHVQTKSAVKAGSKLKKAKADGKTSSGTAKVKTKNIKQGTPKATMTYPTKTQSQSKTHRSTSSTRKLSGAAGSARSLIDSGETVCREVACEGLSTSGGYCRLHYIKNWKKIKRKELILKEKRLNQYIEELVIKYPDKYIEAIRQDLANDKDFAKVIYDLDLDEGVDDFDVEGGDSVDSLIDTIKRDFDDEGDGF